MTSWWSAFEFSLRDASASYHALQPVIVSKSIHLAKPLSDYLGCSLHSFMAKLCPKHVVACMKLERQEKSLDSEPLPAQGGISQARSVATEAGPRAKGGKLNMGFITERWAILELDSRQRRLSRARIGLSTRRRLSLWALHWVHHHAWCSLLHPHILFMPQMS